jgi:hypothetical protein
VGPVQPPVQDRRRQGIVRIGEVMRANGDYVGEALDHIRATYDYDSTKGFLGASAGAADAEFDGYEEDAGFANSPWTRVRFENEGIVVHGSISVAMGTYYFTDLDGAETKVHCTLGFVKRGDDVRIFVLESNVPFAN